MKDYNSEVVNAIYNKNPYHTYQYPIHKHLTLQP